MVPPFILLAFRFHGSFYHSCRGDIPDELGIGKDIRVIRHLIETLDELNGRGIPVRGTWDFENAFSLGRIMPAQCMGRVNFGPALMDRKGIVGNVTFDWQLLFNWEVYPLPLKDLDKLKFTAAHAREGPRFFRGMFEVAEAA